MKKNNSNHSFLIDLMKFIFFLVFTLILYNSFTFGLSKLLIETPNIIKFRLVSTISQIISLFILYIIYHPSLRDLGFNWHSLSRKVRIFIIVSFTILCLLIPLSYFIMSAKRIFALVTNFHFGLITPIFEELIFRGYWWERLNKHNRNICITLLATSILFALFHFGYFFIISYGTQFHPDASSMTTIIFTKVGLALILGLIFGFIRIKFKDVSVPIIFHGLFNIFGN